MRSFVATPCCDDSTPARAQAAAGPDANAGRRASVDPCGTTPWARGSGRRSLDRADGRLSLVLEALGQVPHAGVSRAR